MEMLAALTHQVLTLAHTELAVAREATGQLTLAIACQQGCYRQAAGLFGGVGEAAGQELAEALVPSHQVCKAPVHLQLQRLLKCADPGLQVSLGSGNRQAGCGLLRSTRAAWRRSQRPQVWGLPAVLLCVLAMSCSHSCSASST
jgi:hypothetical protein